MWQLGLVVLGAQIPSQIEPQQGKCWFECQYTTGPEGGDPDCTEPHKGKLEISAVQRTGQNAETRRSGPGQTDEAPHSSDLHLECEVGQGHLAEVALCGGALGKRPFLGPVECTQAQYPTARR